MFLCEVTDFKNIARVCAKTRLVKDSHMQICKIKYLFRKSLPSLYLIRYYKN